MCPIKLPLSFKLKKINQMDNLDMKKPYILFGDDELHDEMSI